MAVAGLDKQNGVTLGRILGRTNVGEAEESGGKMTATVRIPEDQCRPAVELEARSR